jgi:hypothetical protein
MSIDQIQYAANTVLLAISFAHSCGKNHRNELTYSLPGSLEEGESCGV